MVRSARKAFLLGVVLALSCWSWEAGAQDLYANAYGGGGYEYAYSLQQTPDGGYVMSGPATSFGAGGYDYWILKLDASGNVMWQKTYGGDHDDIPNAMLQRAEGGYVLAGRTQSFGAGGFDVWVLALDASGNVVWQKTYGGSGDDYGYSVRQTPDGGFLVVGGTGSYGAGGLDYWVLRLDSSGNVVWQKTVGGPSTDMAYAACLTADGGFVVAGGAVSYGAGKYDAWIIKLDASGNRVWQKAFGGALDDLAFAVQQTDEGGYIVAGRTDSFGAGSTDFWLLKLDSSGSLVWQRTYGGSALDWAFAVLADADGGYVVAGRTDSFGAGSADAWILKVDSSGGVSWQRTFGGIALDYAYCLWPALDGSVLVGGVTGSFGAGNYDAMLLKIETSCSLATSCPHFSTTSAAPGTPSPTVTTTTKNPASSSCSAATTAVVPAAATASKAVPCSYPVLPDADSLILKVTRSGGDPVLNWLEPGGTCAVSGYGVYRGAFPVFPYNHTSLDCSVAGLNYVDSLAGANQYYLVVPHNAYLEGSYGKWYDGAAWYEIPPGSSPCRPQCLLACPGGREDVEEDGPDASADQPAGSLKGERGPR